MHKSVNSKDQKLFIHQLFEHSVLENPKGIAVIDGKQALTYQELDDRADKLCQAILHSGCTEPVVSLSTTRCIEMVISVLAILKAGKAYLPLDPALPPQRLKQLIANSEISCCLSTAVDQAVFADLSLQIILSDQEYNYPYTPVVNPGNMAYVLFTSGSTGQPKGVCMGHKALINLLEWQKKNSKAGPASKTLQFAPLSFDVSFQEIFSTFSTGGTLVLLNDDLRLDPHNLLIFIQEQHINRIFLPFVALQFLAESAINNKLFPGSLQEIMTAGEQLKITPQVSGFLAGLTNCVLFNQYGPTESHVVTQLKLEGDPLQWPALPTIGKPIDNAAIVIVDENLNEVQNGDAGELCISGICLAEGYLNLPDLTKEKFITRQDPVQGETVVYRTGDVARFLEDGNIEFLGRKDDQVKIRGYRIELAEVEAAINSIPGVRQAVVTGKNQLIAYVMPADSNKNVSVLAGALKKILPEYMIPSHFIWMDTFPKTSSGKIDKKNLPEPDSTRPDLSTAYKKPGSEAEKNISKVWKEILQISKAGTEDNFFDLGGNSLLALKAITALKQQYDYIVPVTKFYQYPTIKAITGYLQSGRKKLTGRTSPLKAANGDIAVIGMACRFPGANNISELWEFLKNGQETISFFSDDELDPSIPDSVKKNPDYVKARGIINHADQFDAAFFGLNPRLAEAMDPQQRVFLEIAWEALETAGYVPQQYQGTVGVYAGCGNNSYFINNVLQNSALVNQVGDFQVMTVNEKDYIASRTAYQLNLRGPAVSVYSACSTSLLAIAQAVESIRSGKCEIALAGGASIKAPFASGHLYEEGSILSSDGHCRPFDSKAEGTVFSDGAGVVLLKSLDAAIRDGDKIYSVIKGIGINNDGSDKGSFTAPNAEGQAGAIRIAMEDAGVVPAEISYIEAHGTATPIGDPIEVEGLKMAFGELPGKQTCVLGSIKSNMGHLTAAAGVAGFIKTTLALCNRQIPPTAGFEKPNLLIDFENSPFYVTNTLTEWTADKALKAGVSSFGVGGTNVHVVLEEYKAAAPISGEGRPFKLLTWSAKSKNSLERYGEQLLNYIQQNTLTDVNDMAYTLQTTRAEYTHRSYAVINNTSELAEIMAAAPALKTRVIDDKPAELVFTFPGQGAQYINMGLDLYYSEPVYKNAIDECAELLKTVLETDIREIIFPAQSTDQAVERLQNTRYAQPAIFITEYALAKLWISWGAEPAIFCGHSIGEFVAAHLAGVFSLQDALSIVAARGKMVSELPSGSMLSVRMSAEQLSEIIPGTLSLAAVNSSKLSVVAGTHEAIAAFSKQLDTAGIGNRLLATSHAFHSAMIDPVLDDFAALVSKLELKKPQTPIVSTVTGKWLTDNEAVDANYWAGHLRATVRFADAIDFITAELEHPLFLEAGPGTTLATLIRQQAGIKSAVFSSLDKNHAGKHEYQPVLNTLGQLWLNGVSINWASFYQNQQRVKLTLPAYAFDRKRCWADPVDSLPAMCQIPPQGEQNSSIPMKPTTYYPKVIEVLENASGIDMQDAAPDMSFFELGLDSLLLTQLSITLKKEFGLPFTFRQLSETYFTPALLAAQLDANMPSQIAKPVGVGALNQQAVSQYNTVNPSADSALGLIAQQLQLLARQVALMQGGESVTAPVATAAAFSTVASSGSKPVTDQPAGLSPEEELEIKKPFGATARIERHVTKLDDKQQRFLQNLTQNYNNKTRKSKEYAQQHRSYMSDPRVVSGFKPLTKELVYPIVANRSDGSRLWDLDGNEYIDVLNGFGSTMFGYQPAFIKDALHVQIDKGYELGPQHELAGQVCKLLCEFTGFDRAALCNTGSEAVIGTMRIARTVTGRSLIVAFSGSYHGIADEVLVRGTKSLRSFPAVAGVMPEAVQNMLILDYGTDESLQIIKDRAHELAAVLVEPVQSRRPEFRPVDFLKKLREITSTSGTVLIFDEVITGFRMHPGGAQAMFGIKADLASYGKVIGGGLPIGAIAGKSMYMDALDGGFWEYGDSSFPAAGVTYFAGTFVRHPLALAAAKASLQYMRVSGPALQTRLNDKTEQMAAVLNADFDRKGLPFFVAQFGSLWKIKFKEEIPYSDLLFTLLRNKGIHICDGFPCFMTEAHTAEEIQLIIKLIIESVDELIMAGFFKANISKDEDVSATHYSFNRPPVPGARLGRDKEGNPAWFISNPSAPGKYLQVDYK